MAPPVIGSRQERPDVYEAAATNAAVRRVMLETAYLQAPLMPPKKTETTPPAARVLRG